jgi:hypothetical protein
MCQNFHLHGHRLLIVCVIPLILAGTSVASEVQVLPGDAPVKMRARIGDDTTFVKRLGLMASVAVPELIFRSTDLVRTDGKEQIGRQQVALTSTVKVDLDPNTPKDVEIKITGVKLPGTYNGTLSFSQPGQGLNASVYVPIELIVEGVPKLTQRKGSEAVRIQLFDCAWLGCLFARLIQPGAFSSTYPLTFDNASLEAFDMTATVNVTGDVTHGSLENVLTVSSPVPVPVQPVFTLPIKIKDSNPLPDHYVGDAQLKMAVDAPPLKIPLEVNVRTGPIWPIVMLILGILLGRFVKYMKDKGTPQSDLLFDLHQLESRITVFSADLQLLQPMLESVKALIYGMQLDAAKTEMTAIENRLTLLSTLRGLKQTLERSTADPQVGPILKQIEQARNLIAFKQDKESSALVADIEKAVKNLVAPAPPAAVAFDLATKQATKATAAASRTVLGIAETPKWYFRWLSLFTGINGGLRAEVTLWVLRPATYLLLIGALMILGMQQLYLKNATFGADPFSDYFGLLVWAMSSDVASRTLGSLKPGS